MATIEKGNRFEPKNTNRTQPEGTKNKNLPSRLAMGATLIFSLTACESFQRTALPASTSCDLNVKGVLNPNGELEIIANSSSLECRSSETTPGFIQFPTNKIRENAPDGYRLQPQTQPNLKYPEFHIERGELPKWPDPSEETSTPHHYFQTIPNDSEDTIEPYIDPLLEEQLRSH